jgi:hypothetical protein
MDGNVAQSVPASGIVDETIAARVISGKATATGSDPKAAQRVLEKRLDIAIRQSAGYSRIGPVVAESISVPSRQTILRADPEKSDSILRDRRDDSAAHATVGTRSLEDDVRYVAPALLRWSNGCRHRYQKTGQCGQSTSKVPSIK